jgi:hypothetical protein
MTRYHGAVKTCRYANDGSVSASTSAGRPAHVGADGADNPWKFQSRKRRPSGVLSTLIPRVPGRRLTAMKAQVPAAPASPLSSGSYWRSGPSLGVKPSVGCPEPDAGGCGPANGREATAGKPGRGNG